MCTLMIASFLSSWNALKFPVSQVLWSFSALWILVLSRVPEYAEETKKCFIGSKHDWQSLWWEESKLLPRLPITALFTSCSLSHIVDWEKVEAQRMGRTLKKEVVCSWLLWTIRFSMSIKMMSVSWFFNKSWSRNTTLDLLFNKSLLNFYAINSFKLYYSLNIKAFILLKKVLKSLSVWMYTHVCRFPKRSKQGHITWMNELQASVSCL